MIWTPIIVLFLFDFACFEMLQLRSTAVSNPKSTAVQPGVVGGA